MKRFITVSSKHAGEVLLIIRDVAAGKLAADAYDWVKRKLQQKQIAHNDQQASHQGQLPHQGGFTSFHLDNNGQWMRVDH